MSKISEYLAKNGITDSEEVSKLEAFFEEVEVKEELEKIEKKRNKIITNYISIILLLVVMLTFFLKLFLLISLIIFSCFFILLYFFLLRKAKSLYNKNHYLYYISFGFLIFISIASLGYILFLIIIISFLTILTYPIFLIIEKILTFLKIIEKTLNGYKFTSEFIIFIKNNFDFIDLIHQIKIKVLNKLSKLIHSSLEYDGGNKYAFLKYKYQNLITDGLLNYYSQIDFIEDSILCNIKENGKILSINGLELKTSKTVGNKNRRNIVTNHCYLLKVNFPDIKNSIKKSVIVKKQGSKVYNNTYILNWGIAGLFIGFIIGVIIKYLQIIFISIFIFTLIGYVFRGKYIKAKKIELENIEFEKMFDVYCEDQVLSRMILTTSFMDRLLTFSKKSSYKYEFLFTGNNFYIKWDVGFMYLDINILKNLEKNIYTFLDWYIQMKNIISLIEDLNLIYYSKIDQNLTEPQNIINS